MDSIVISFRYMHIFQLLYHFSHELQCFNKLYNHCKCVADIHADNYLHYQGTDVLWSQDLFFLPQEPKSILLPEFITQQALPMLSVTCGLA